MLGSHNTGGQPLQTPLGSFMPILLRTNMHQAQQCSDWEDENVDDSSPLPMNICGMSPIIEFADETAICSNVEVSSEPTVTSDIELEDEALVEVSSIVPFETPNIIRGAAGQLVDVSSTQVPLDSLWFSTSRSALRIVDGAEPTTEQQTLQGLSLTELADIQASWKARFLSKVYQTDSAEYELLLEMSRDEYNEFQRWQQGGMRRGLTEMLDMMLGNEPSSSSDDESENDYYHCCDSYADGLEESRDEYENERRYENWVRTSQERVSCDDPDMDKIEGELEAQWWLDDHQPSSRRCSCTIFGGLCQCEDKDHDASQEWVEELEVDTRQSECRRGVPWGLSRNLYRRGHGSNRNYVGHGDIM